MIGKSWLRGIGPTWYVNNRGFTVFLGSGAATRRVYVAAPASGGSDSNDGFTDTTPVATIAKAKTLMRSGSPDHMLFNKGDEWDENFGATISLSGKSRNEPMFIGAYGAGARPIIKHGTSAAIVTIAAHGKNIAIKGIEFYADACDPGSPNFNGVGGVAATLSLGGSQNFVHIEDCVLSYSEFGLSLNNAGGVGDQYFVIRRNIILNCYGAAGNASGLGIADNAAAQIAEFNGVPTRFGYCLVEENLFDHNGWNEFVDGAGANALRHNVYLHDSTPPTIFRRNISFDASAAGATYRCGGTAWDNLLLNNPIGIALYSGFQHNPSTVRHNVFAMCGDIRSATLVTNGTTTAPSRVLNFASVPSDVAVGVSGLDVFHAGIPTGAKAASKTATTVTLDRDTTGNVGNGDTVAFYAPRGTGLSVNCAGGYSPSAITSSGSNILTFATALPASVTVGQLVSQSFTGVSSKIPALTTVSAISADRKTVTMSASCTATINPNTQDVIVFYTDGVPLVSPIDITDNIFTTQSMLRPSQGGECIKLEALTMGINVTGNYFYNWASAVTDNGLGNNVSGNTTNLAASPVVTNLTIEEYDLSIGGPGTAEHFIAGAMQQSEDNWDDRYTANAANNFFRAAVGWASVASTP